MCEVFEPDSPEIRWHSPGLDMSIIKYLDGTEYGVQLLRIKDRIVQPSRVDHLLTMYLSLKRSVSRLFSN